MIRLFLDLVFLLFLYGAFIEPHRKKVRHIKISEDKGLKIAHFSDSHFAWHTSYRRFRKFVKVLEQEKPDLILFSGDLFDKVSWGERHYQEVEGLLTGLEAPLGKLAILGNHDFAGNGQGSKFVSQLLERSGFQLLVNACQTIDDRLSISGLDDLREGRPDFDIQPEPADFSLLMIHEPDTVLSLKHAGDFDLIIAGHSHGGQIRIGKLRMKNNGSKSYDRGLYELPRGGQLFVNSGLGQTFLPIRIGVPPEIVFYEL
ncbi:metallophosphoesterase [Lactococcus termiticola]|uniref:Calcineurin-like phosphoesterase domain-containing protein n=1 Tax=Lactococcus termiticola TaxID=2169526 RepID=A0A2R5HDM2_9LACT|nr:metallophosphoesterase [Lactococcus termiticola]GBG96167.1 hypothetical protein NtB2_00272 [Lactococcus termiticola]